ncbi:MAG: flagellin, partial [Planctomycetes bacterium]|nr:flagellin [Planctomycetota bacterium]
MSLRINFNLAALLGHTNLTRNDRLLSAVLDRLSSGQRLRRAADDPAGLVMANGMRHRIAGLTQAAANVEETVSLLQTADGGIDAISGILNRMRALAVAAANEGAGSDQQRAALQAEFDEAVGTITGIAGSTRFGSLSLLDGGLGDLSLSDAARASYSSASADATRLPAGILAGSDVVIAPPSGNLTHESLGVTLDDDGNPLTAPPAASTPLNGLRQNGTQLTIGAATTLTVTGPSGSKDLTLTPATTIGDLVALINVSSGETGARATYDAASGQFTVESVAFGGGVIALTAATDLSGGSDIAFLDTDTTSATNPLHAPRDIYQMPLLNGALPAVAGDAIQGLIDAGSGSTLDAVAGGTFAIGTASGRFELPLTATTTIQQVVDAVNAADLGVVAAFDPVTGTLGLTGGRGSFAVSSSTMTTVPSTVGLLDRRTDLADSAGSVQTSIAGNATLDVSWTDANGTARTVRLTQDATSKGGLDFVNLTSGPETSPPYTGWEAGAWRVRVADPTKGAFGATLIVPTAAVTAERRSTMIAQIGADNGDSIVVDIPD